MVAVVKAGANVPELSDNADKSAFELPALVTIKVYVFVVPSCAVTNMLMVLLPTFKAIAPDTLPLVVVTPFTVIVAFASALVGVMVILVVALPTLAV